MSDITEDFDSPFTVTLKGGSGYDKPWIVIRGNTAAETIARLGEASIDGLLERTAEYAAKFQEANGAAAPAGGATGSPSVVQSGPSTQGQQAAAPSAAAPSRQLHPEGLKCGSCQGDVVFKEITQKKPPYKSFKMWVCENQRSRGDGHHSEFIN